MKGLSPQDNKLLIASSIIFICEVTLMILGLVFGR